MSFDEPTQYLMTTDKLHLSYSQVRRYLYLGFTYIYEAKTCSHPKAFDFHHTNVTNDTLANKFKNVVFRTALLGFWEWRLDFIWLWTGFLQTFSLFCEETSHWYFKRPVPISGKLLSTTISQKRGTIWEPRLQRPFVSFHRRKWRLCSYLPQP